MRSSLVRVHTERAVPGRTIEAFKSLIATTYARVWDLFRSFVYAVNFVPVLFVSYSKQGKPGLFANEGFKLMRFLRVGSKCTASASLTNP
jgi:hypothetical protein